MNYPPLIKLQHLLTLSPSSLDFILLMILMKIKEKKSVSFTKKRALFWNLANQNTCSFAEIVHSSNLYGKYMTVNDVDMTACMRSLCNLPLLRGKVKVKSAYEPDGAYPGFCSMKPHASPLKGYPSIKFACTHLYTWEERGTVRVKCLAQEQHNAPGQGSNPDRLLWSWAH